MDRRWAGLLIFLLVVVVAVTVPNVIGKPIAGRPVAERIPGPPAVGQCLTLAAGVSPSQAHGSDAVPREPQSCLGEHFGEVVAVLDAGRPAQPMPGDPDDAPGTVYGDSSRSACEDAAWRYVGVPVGADHLPAFNAYWSPVAFAHEGAFGPTERQKAAGQTWTACVLGVNDKTGSPVRYAGTSRNGFVTGTMPREFSICLSTADLASAEPGTCAAPHPVEVFGDTSTAKMGLTQDTLDRSCRELVQTLTKMADPTARGQLQVRALAVHGTQEVPTPGLGSAADPSGFAACVVVAPPHHELSASLLGLGAGAIPWSR